jgi:hypothetical protein
MDSRSDWDKTPMRTLLLAIAFLVLSSPALANVYYVSFSSGSNLNSGTSTSLAWKSVPGMQTGSGCGGATPSVTPAAGDRIIFKGGDSWPAACFQWVVPSSGTSGNPIYYGVDQTYYSGSSWTQPLFDLNYQEPTGDVVVTGSVSYVTWDNIKILHQGLNASTSVSYTEQQAFSFNDNSLHGLLLENCTLQDWGAVNQIGSNTLNYSAGSVLGNFTINNCTFSDANGWNVISGTRTATTGFGGAAQGVISNTFSVLENSIIHDTTAGCFQIRICHDNVFYNQAQAADGTMHSQVIEDDDDNGGGVASQIYNNLIHDENAGVVMLVCDGDTIYNNVAWNNQNNFWIRLGGGCGTSGSSTITDIYNNTFDCSGSAPVCFGTDTKSGANILGTVNLENNIWVTNGNPISINASIATFNNTNNYTMPTSEATTYGFTIANKYKSSSPDTSNVVGKGVNLTGSCGGMLIALCQDASGAPWFGGSYVTRPTGSTGWDLGAYQGQGGSGGGPPVSVITAPSNNAVISGSSVTLTSTCTPVSPATVSSIQFTFDGNPFGTAGTSSPYSITLDSLYSSNQQHTIGASCTDSNAQTGTATPITVTISNSIPGCFVANQNWSTSQSFTPQSSGTFTLTFNVTPNTTGSGMDTVVGLSQAAATAYGNMAAIVRFNGAQTDSSGLTGNIDVYNGTASDYQAASNLVFSAGTTYSFTMTVNMTAATYSVSVNGTTLATNYAFRSGAPASSLGFINAQAADSNPDTVKVCSVSLGGSTSLTFSPPSLSFGTVSEGSNASLSVTVSSSGGNTTFSSVGISGSSDFTITANTCTGSTASCFTTVQFAPTVVGAESATLTYTDSATGSPQTVSITGTGVASAGSIAFFNTQGGSLSSLSFGGVQLYTSQAQGPIVVQVTSGPVTFSSVAISGTNAADFAVSANTCSGSVASSCSLIVIYTPRVLGSEVANVVFTSSAVGSPQSLPVSGNGVNLQLPAPFSF